MEVWSLISEKYKVFWQAATEWQFAEKTDDSIGAVTFWKRETTFRILSRNCSIFMEHNMGYMEAESSRRIRAQREGINKVGMKRIVATKFSTQQGFSFGNPKGGISKKPFLTLGKQQQRYRKSQIFRLS